MVPQKILVVDDEPDIVELIAFNLKAEGYDVVTAANVAEEVVYLYEARDIRHSGQAAAIATN